MTTNAAAWLYCEEHGIVDRKKRFTPLKAKSRPWYGGIVALDTEGTNETRKFTATVQWDDPKGNVERARFRRPEELANFLISQAQKRYPVLIYCHNLEWDLQVLWSWLGYKTELIYERHMARRNGSALKATFDYVGRHENHRKVSIRDSFALFPLSLAELGHVVGLPKYRTPRALIPNMVNWRTGDIIEAPPVDDDDGVKCEHGLVECMECYDLRDVAILHKAMRLYIDECDDAGVSPALTRSAHAMRDFRTNYLSEALMQYTEKQNLRAEAARYGGRSQMLRTGLVVAEDHEIVAQADINSEYPAVMLTGKFPDADRHVILSRPDKERLRDHVGWAWATVKVTNASRPGPLIYRHPVTGRISYPSGVTLQGAWTTDELVYAMDLGCDVEVYRLEGCHQQFALNPFDGFIHMKWAERAAYKEHGDARQLSTKLTMNGFSGKFGMRWTEPMIAFKATDPDEQDFYSRLTDMPCERDDQDPNHYPDYVMVPWSSLIMARGRIMLHKFGMELQRHGAQLLCCDTDSWAFKIDKNVLLDQFDQLFGDELGEWSLEGIGEWKQRVRSLLHNDARIADDLGVIASRAILTASSVMTVMNLARNASRETYRAIALTVLTVKAFRGVAPKEYAFYVDDDELNEGAPSKARAKGVGSIGGKPRERLRAIDHYLRTGEVWYQRPQKTRSVLIGKPMATFLTVGKKRQPQPPEVMPLIYDDFAHEIQESVRRAERQTLWAKREAAATHDDLSREGVA